MLTGSLEYFSRIWLQFSLTETRQFKCSTNLCIRLPFKLRLYSTIFTPLVLFKLVLGNIMSQGCDMVADMLLLKPCNGVAGNQTASLRFPKTAMQMIFQNLCTKVNGGVCIWVCGVQLYKQRQEIYQNVWNK